jgi:hypothetical protein
VRNQKRFDTLVKEHCHAVNAAVSGLSALPGTAQPIAATRAMTRFLNNEDIGFPALLEPAQDATRTELARSPSPFVLCVHDWCMFQFNSHSSKKDRLKRSHDKDLGYELGTALLVDADDGRPLGPMELRLRTSEGMLSTRVNETTLPPGHVDELLEVMEESRNWKLNKRIIHVIDREADSVGHYREWSAKGHRFLVRADDDRLVLCHGKECSLADVVRGLSLKFQDVLDGKGNLEVIAIAAGRGRIQVAETEVVLHRPAKKTIHGEKTAGGNKKQVEVPGEPLKLRLVVTRVVNEVGKVIAEWCLLTNVSSGEASAAVLGRWYAWRWVIETYHKLLKSSGMNAEEWQQCHGGAFFRRLCVATMSCLTVWHLQRDASEEAKDLRKVLVRLSGRQMGYGVESTAPALLAGLEKLLAIEDLLESEDLAEVLALARKVLPRLFRSG